MEIAVIKTGGKQYKVKVGDIIKVEKLPGDPPAGGEIEFLDLLYGKKVIATITGQAKAPKVDILKFRAKKNYKRATGHRQTLSVIKIEKIQ